MKLELNDNYKLIKIKSLKKKFISSVLALFIFSFLFFSYSNLVWIFSLLILILLLNQLSKKIKQLNY